MQKWCDAVSLHIVKFFKCTNCILIFIAREKKRLSDAFCWFSGFKLVIFRYRSIESGVEKNNAQFESKIKIQQYNNIIHIMLNEFILSVWNDKGKRFAFKSKRLIIFRYRRMSIVIKKKHKQNKQIVIPNYYAVWGVTE